MWEDPIPQWRYWDIILMRFKLSFKDISQQQAFRQISSPYKIQSNQKTVQIINAYDGSHLSFDSVGDISSIPCKQAGGQGSYSKGGPQYRCEEDQEYKISDILVLNKPVSPADVVEGGCDVEWQVQGHHQVPIYEDGACQEREQAADDYADDGLVGLVPGIGPVPVRGVEECLVQDVEQGDHHGIEVVEGEEAEHRPHHPQAQPQGVIEQRNILDHLAHEVENIVPPHQVDQNYDDRPAAECLAECHIPSPAQLDGLSILLLSYAP